MPDAAQLVKRLDEIVAEQERMRQAMTELTRERDAYHELYLEALERCRKLELGLLGQKAERLSPDESQLSLAMMGMLVTNDADVEPAPEHEVAAHTRSKPTGRKPLPENLPRVDVVVLPHEVEREGLNAFEQIGQEVTETIERRPASVVVVRTFKPKYVRRDRDKNDTEVYVAQSHPLPIPRGIAGPDLLADSIVKRWDDHQPLNRLERVYARDGLELARSTICGWHIALAELFLARLRNRRFFSLDELNVAIAELLEELNTRPFKKLPGCRRAAFESIDQPALKPLPARRFVPSERAWQRVNIDTTSSSTSGSTARRTRSSASASRSERRRLRSSSGTAASACTVTCAATGDRARR